MTTMQQTAIINPWADEEMAHFLRLNDRVVHCFPPYRHEKQRSYLELAHSFNTLQKDDQWLRRTTETVLAGGGTEAEARWYYEAMDRAAVEQAIVEGSFMATSSFLLYLTFARKLEGKE